MFRMSGCRARWVLTVRSSSCLAMEPVTGHPDRRHVHEAVATGQKIAVPTVFKIGDAACSRRATGDNRSIGSLKPVSGGRGRETSLAGCAGGPVVPDRGVAEAPCGRGDVALRPPLRPDVANAVYGVAEPVHTPARRNVTVICGSTVKAGR